MEEKNHTGTSEKLVQSAEKLFAGKGFYGTSIRDVAETLSIAKSSVLHHFASKEKLYAAVLQNIADEMIREIRAIRQGPEDEAGQMRSFVGLLCDNSRDRPDRDLIILRELLDNRARVDTARKWYFSPYLEELAGIVRSGQDKGRFKPIHPGLFILHLLGAHHYFTISLPTVRQLLPPVFFDRMIRDHRAELTRMVEDRLVIGPDGRDNP